MSFVGGGEPRSICSSGLPGSSESFRSFGEVSGAGAMAGVSAADAHYSVMYIPWECSRDRDWIARVLYTGVRIPYTRTCVCQRPQGGVRGAEYHKYKLTELREFEEPAR